MSRFMSEVFSCRDVAVAALDAALDAARSAARAPRAVQRRLADDLDRAHHAAMRARVAADIAATWAMPHGADVDGDGLDRQSARHVVTAAHLAARDARRAAADAVRHAAHR